MTKISIVIPVYGVEKYIAATIRTICAQTFRDFELILVDDGSPDASIKVAEEELSGQNVAYRVIRQDNRGAASARNIGIAAAKGEWVICIDSDDGMHPQALSILERVVIKCPEDVSVIGVDFQVVKDFGGLDNTLDEDPAFKVYSKYELSDEFLLRKIKLIAPGLLIRKSWFDAERIRYDENIRFSEDQFFVWTILSHAEKICFINEKLYWYVTRSNSTMTSSGRERIMTGYAAFHQLDEKAKNNAVDFGENQNLIFPRWIIGVLHAVSKYMDYNEFEKLADMFKYRDYMRKLYHFPDARVKLLARLNICSKHIFYMIAKLL